MRWLLVHTRVNQVLHAFLNNSYTSGSVCTGQCVWLRRVGSEGHRALILRGSVCWAPLVASHSGMGVGVGRPPSFTRWVKGPG